MLHGIDLIAKIAAVVGSIVTLALLIVQAQKYKLKLNINLVNTLEENSKEIPESNTFTLLEVILIFLKYKKKILLITGIICIVSIILYFFVSTPIFESDATIKSTTKSSGLLGSLEGNLSDIGALDDLGLSGGGKSAKELAFYQNILNSRRCLENVIIKFDLMKRDDFKFMEDAVKNFQNGKMEIEQDKLSGIMTVKIFDKDPAFAKEILLYLLDQLDKINIELNIANAKNNKEFIEKRYFQAREDLTKAEDSLKAFQLIYGIAPDLQIKAAAQSVFTIEAEMKAEEVKLDVLRKILNNDQPEVKMQETKVNSLKAQISGIQTSTDLRDILRLGNSPQIAMNFLRLQREMEIQTKILTFLLPVYEQAKIEEKRETPTIVILDQPQIAEKKVKPKRLTMVLILTFIGFVASTIFFITKQKWRNYKSKHSFEIPNNF